MAIIKLSNTYTKLTTGNKKATLGFIGGSITLGSSAKTVIEGGVVVSKDGDILQSYVNRVSTWFKETYPDATIETVNAGISDTATNFGIYRLEQDLMNTNGHAMPDLVFIEFTTNDFSYETQMSDELKLQIESIFRNIWSYNPYAEIVVLSTNVNNSARSVAAYRAVTEYYGVPFIDVGGPLCELKRERGYEQESKGNFCYTIDNLHPSAKGYEIYFDVIKPVLEENLLSGDTRLYNYKENLPIPLYDNLIDSPTIITADKLTLSGNAVLKNGALQAGMYGTELEVQTVGFEDKHVLILGESEIKATFCNSALGILVYLCGVGFELEWQVDGGEFKIFCVNKNSFAFQLYEHPQVFMFEHYLSPGEHTVTFKFSENTQIKLGGLIVNGEN